MINNVAPPYMKLLYKFIYATVFSTFIVGLLVLIGWYTQNELLIQIRPTFVPMQYNTALGFLLSALGFYAILRSSYKAAIVLGSLLLAIGLGTLSEYIFLYDLHIDQLFMDHYITTHSSHPGRMAPNTALCFTLVSLCLSLASLRESHLRLTMLGSLSSLVIGLGITALVGYLFSIESAYGWGQMTQMAVHTSLGFITIASGLLAYTSCKNRVLSGHSPEWLPISMGILFLSMTLSIWQALHAQQTGEHGASDEIVLIFGLLLSASLVLSVRLAQLAHKQLDITKELNEELHDYKNSLEQLVEEKTTKLNIFSSAVSQSGEGIVITNRQGVVEYANPAFMELTGYSKEEVIGNTPGVLKSGFQDEQFYKNMWDTISRGEIFQSRMVNRRKDNSFYPALLSISSIKDSRGKIDYFVGMQQDLTAYEGLEAEFHQAQKMEAIGTLVGGIAHDFNNSLAGITGNLFLLRKFVMHEPEALKRLEQIETLSFRAAGMIHQMLTFARKDLKSMNPMTISSFLKETVKLHMISLPESIHLTYKIDDSEMQIRGDINLLQQVIMNLLNNARDAVFEVKRPEVSLELARFEADQDFVSKQKEIEFRSFACICVTDNGEGIKESDLEHIFEPFFTTKEVGKGTGLGLSMAYGAIKSHGGVLEVESERGSGTTFKIYLPLLEEDQISAIINEQEEIYEGDGETLLLVDDEPSVVSSGRDVLESLGYRVLTAADGVEAVERYESEKNNIDLTILDVVMPKMGGIDAAKEIRKRNARAKIIFATGYDRTHTLRRDDNIDSELLIRKPFTTARISKMIRNSLDN